MTILGGQTFHFTANSLVQQPPALFTGSVFLADASWNAMSDLIAVPEPTTIALAAAGSLFLLRRRR